MAGDAPPGLVELIGEAYSFQDLEEFRVGVLEVIDRAVPSAWVSYNEVGSEPDRTFVVMIPTFPEELFGAFARYAHQNPLIATHRRTGDGRPRRMSDLISRADFQRLELYQECYRPMGVESQVAFTLPARPPLLLGVALSRGAEDFADDEVELLALARPHLIQAYRNAELSSARADVLRVVEDGLQASDHHAVVLDAHGRVEFATATARALLGGLRDGERLPPEVAAWVAGRRAGARVTAPLIATIGGASVLVRLLPRRTGEPREVLIAEGGPGRMSPAALRALGLTEREAETLHWVVLGASAATAAERLGIARRTADKHLQKAYAKLGVTSAAEAVATAWAAVGTSR